jgi:hypothetical protein
MGFISGMGVGTWWRMGRTRINVSALLGGIPAFDPFCCMSYLPLGRGTETDVVVTYFIPQL